MGFRDPEAFNQALLAKQAWRILQNPESLCARVLKARYFKEGSIMIATCPSGASFTFRSILHGRDLLQDGLVWRIGDGTSVNVHHDNWIPRQGSLKPLGQVYMHGVTKVADLLNVQGDTWDDAKIDGMFSPDDAQDIKQIVVGGPGVRDYLAWNFTKNGQFTVKSAYHLKMSSKGARIGRPGTSSSLRKHKMWLALWSTDVPNKAKIHTWRLLRNGLAIGVRTTDQGRSLLCCMQ